MSSEHDLPKDGAKIIGIEGHGFNDILLAVYIRFAHTPVLKSREVLPGVFADYDRHGAIVGLEFSSPGDYDIDAMQYVSKLVNVPQLRAIDVSRMPVNVEELMV